MVGRPMPTKQTRAVRAAGAQPRSPSTRRSPAFAHAHRAACTCSSIHALEPVAVARDRVPRAVEARCRGRSSRARTTDALRAARRATASTIQCGSTIAPGRGSSSSTTSSTVTIERAGAQHGLLLHAEDAPDLHVASPIGALRVHDPDVRTQRGHRGEPLAGERARRRRRCAVCCGRSVPRVAAQHAEGQAAAPAAYAAAMPAWQCSSSSSGCGQPCSTASRRRCSEPTPGLPPHEKTSFRAQPMPISWS